MKTLTAGQARGRLQQLLLEMTASHEPIHIMGKNANAVLVAEEDWRAIQETLHLLSIPGMRESIRAGKDTPLAECSAELHW